MVGKIDTLLLCFLRYIERIHVYAVTDKDKIYSFALVHRSFPKTMETIVHAFALLGHIVGVMQFEIVVQRRLVHCTVSLAAIHIAHKDDGILGGERCQTLFQQFDTFLTCLFTRIIKMGVSHAERFARSPVSEYSPIDKAWMATIPSDKPCAVGKFREPKRTL